MLHDKYICRITVGLLLLLALIVLCWPGNPNRKKQLVLCGSLYFAMITGFWYASEILWMFSTADVTWSGAGHWILFLFYMPWLLICFPTALLCDFIGLKGISAFIVHATWCAFVYTMPVWQIYGRKIREL